MVEAYNTPWPVNAGAADDVREELHKALDHQGATIRETTLPNGQQQFFISIPVTGPDDWYRKHASIDQLIASIGVVVGHRNPNIFEANAA